MKRPRSALAMAAATVLASMLVLTMASPAAAEGQPTTTKFDSASSQDVTFGSPWFVKIQVRLNDYYTPLDEADGTVNVFAEGIAEPLGRDLPLTHDGIAYFAQPANRALLAAGTYVLSATFTPAAGSEITKSRTTTSTTIVIMPLGVTPSFTVVDDPSRYAEPTVEARLGGEYVDATGRAPAGLWSVVVTDDSGTEVFSETAAQKPDAALPTLITLASGIKPGKSYSVVTTFMPDETIAAGLAVTAPKTQKLTTAPAGALDRAVLPVSLPWWLIITLLALTCVLAIAVVALLVVNSRRKPHAGASGSAATESDDPQIATSIPPQGAEHHPGAVDIGAVTAVGTVAHAGSEQPAFVADWDPFATTHDDEAESSAETAITTEFPPVEQRESWSLGDDRD
ncbi:MAG: hypothetical protein ACOH1T_05885 [Microbacteriaceae bacterium]